MTGLQKTKHRAKQTKANKIRGKENMGGGGGRMIFPPVVQMPMITVIWTQFNNAIRVCRNKAMRTIQKHPHENNKGEKVQENAASTTQAKVDGATSGRPSASPGLRHQGIQGTYIPSDKMSQAAVQRNGSRCCRDLLQSELRLTHPP